MKIKNPMKEDTSVTNKHAQQALFPTSIYVYEVRYRQRFVYESLFSNPNFDGTDIHFYYAEDFRLTFKNRTTIKASWMIANLEYIFGNNKI